MKICTTCQTPRREIDFPYAANTVCLPCHRKNAMRWNELPFEDEAKRPISEKRYQALLKAAEASRMARSARKSTTNSTESTSKGGSND